jgi:hypothetical protein
LDGYIFSGAREITEVTLTRDINLIILKGLLLEDSYLLPLRDGDGFDALLNQCDDRIGPATGMTDHENSTENPRCGEYPLTLQSGSTTFSRLNIRS